MGFRLWTSTVALVVGTGLLAAAGMAGVRGAKAPNGAAGPSGGGGTMRINISDTDVDFLDPALNYDFLGWQIQAATCAKLMNYPDRAGPAGARLVPEVSAGFPRVSANGRTYTFTVRSGFRFSTGAPVTAASFSHAITRALTPRMQSPASSFLTDVAGAAAFQKGRTKQVAGVQVQGNRLVVRLTTVAPDFLGRIAMPFFCAVPSDLPIDPQGVNTPPGSGPYYIASKTPSRSIVLKPNPFYRGPRPHRLDEIRFVVNTNLAQSYLQVQRGQADYDASGLPPAAHAALTSRYGVNRGRYFVHPSNSIIYIALNTSRPFFRGANMRKAVNFALDRRALLRVAGLNAGTASDQLLPPNIPGFENANIYPAAPNLEAARRLTGGRTGRAVLYSGNDPTSRNQAVIIQDNLKQIGIDVEIKTFTFAVQIAKAGKRGEPFDMNLIGWFADYPDPYDFINVLLDGRRIQATNNVNTAYFNVPAYNRKMQAASRLRGGARYRAYGRLDIDISRNQAPFAVLYNLNVREFVSSRIGCYSYHPVWGSLNLALACLR